MIEDIERTFSVGYETFFACSSPTGAFEVVFEDDFATGYFYAIATEPEIKILDALHIYNVANVTDGGKPCKLRFEWTDDGKVALLLINSYCHAVFDFARQAGYCRTGFPVSNGEWGKVRKGNGSRDRLLTDEMIAGILKPEVQS